MKIAAVSMVKNECDIIELFIKINSRFFDAIYILDHGSTDATPEIIKLMKKSGFNVYYTLLKNSIYSQDKITTNAVRQISQMNLYDYIMPIDADELIPDNRIKSIKDFLENNCGKLSVGYFPWKTYCPSNKNYFQSFAPLYSNFLARIAEPVQFFKIIMSNKFGKNCTISMGNHEAMNDEADYFGGKYKMPSHIIHAPIRCEEQAISKVILGSYAFKLKKDRVMGEGFHWDELAREIRKNQYSLTDESLFNMAMNYAVPMKNWIKYTLNDEPNLEIDKIGTKQDTIEFRDLAKIDLMKNLDMEIEKLITINSTQSGGNISMNTNSENGNKLHF